MEISVWNAQDAMFPSALSTIHSPPKQLFTIGNREVLAVPTVAIVGTRRPSDYGYRVTTRLSKALAEAGACIVSGMAYGVDGAAHKAALEVGGRTVAVLGTPIDKPYPLAHRGLYQRIAQRGMVVSEFGPDSTAFKGCFPRRNRIIAGLAQLTIVVEADVKSGSLITAQYALDAGISVAAIPGCIDSSNSTGTNMLLRDGAHVIASIDDALSLVGLLNNAKGDTQLALGLSEKEQAIYQKIEGDGLEMDVIVNATNLPIGECLAVITSLEMKGLVVATSSGKIRQL